MNNIMWEGTVTALSSISHGSETLGTVSYLRREKMFLSDQTIEEVPIISGNAWRGILRDVAADLWWKTVGEPKLTLPVMHALWSGGALAKLSGPTLSGARLQELKNVCPVVGVFGTAGGGRIISGVLQVGKLIPICVETAHLIPEKFLTENLPTLWDITQIEYYSRIPNEFEELDDVDKDSRLARYGVETFLAGTKFYTWCSLTWANDLEASFFNEVLNIYTSNANVGGLARAGHGKLAFNLTSSETINSIDWRTPVQGVDPLKRLEVLSWLD